MRRLHRLIPSLQNLIKYLVGAPRMGRVMAGCINAAVVMTLLCCSVQRSCAKSVDVGGTAGWTSYESGKSTAPNYGAWAASQKFFVGDSLVFKFAPGAHNVWQMKSLAAYQSCDFSGATLLNAGDSGYYSWTGTQPGAYYFSCDKGAEGVGTHCNYNQKLAILVSKIATTPASAPSSAPAKPPSPSPSQLPLPHPALAPAQSPVVEAGPIHAPTPAHSPRTAPATAPIHSSPPTKSPILPPTASPILSPSPTHSPSPAPVAAPAPASKVSPVPSPSMSPSPDSVVATPLASTPGSSASPPMPDLPDVPGGGPASASPSASPNAGVLLRSQPWSSLVQPAILACLLLW